jgi:predicted phage terminase large subunit-like protein
MDLSGITLERVEGELCRRDYSRFFRRAWLELEANTPLVDNWHIDYLCGILQAEAERIAAGKPKTHDLIINIPPRSAKSSIVTIYWQAWIWATYPEIKIITSSYSSDLAVDHSRKTRSLIESDWYKKNFSGFRLRRDVDRMDEFENDKGGMRKAVGSGGSITGRGADIIIADDPLDPRAAYSDTSRETINRWWDETMYSRLNNHRVGLKLIVMQRLHEQDPTGHCMVKFPGVYKLIKIPGEINSQGIEAEPKNLFKYYKKGYFFPARFDADILAGYRQSLGSMGYANQILQSGAPTDGTIYKRAWFSKRWKIPPAQFDEVIQSWDFTFKDLKTSDFVACQVWGRKGGMFFLLYRLKEKLDFVASLAAFRSVTKMYPAAIGKLVESAANGPAIVSALKTEISGIIEIPAKDSKIARACAVTPIWEAGNIVLPDDPGVEEFIDEHVKFPKTKHDDEVDCANQALIYMQSKRSNSGVIDAMGSF